jgi:type IV secretory pathway protease TraF
MAINMNVDNTNKTGKYCGTVKKGEVFVFIDNSKSFDSRYYGPIPADNDP